MLRLRCSPSEFQLGRKNKHRLNLYFAIPNYLHRLIQNYIQPHTRRPDKAHPRSRRVSRHTCRLATKTATALLPTPPSTCQGPLTPAAAPGSPAVPCFGYTRTHTKHKEKKRLWPASNRRRRCPSGSSERPEYVPTEHAQENKKKKKISMCIRLILMGESSTRISKVWK